jgi:hypothetical protein
MFDQILENYRLAAESTMQLQQTMLRGLSAQWPQAFGITDPTAAWTDRAHAAQRKWADTVTEMLTTHRETLDAQYRAGIRLIEDAFRVGEAKDPAQFRRLTEELWRQCFESLKTVTETQLCDIQAALQKVTEAVAQGAATVKP